MLKKILKLLYGGVLVSADGRGVRGWADVGWKECDRVCVTVELVSSVYTQSDNEATIYINKTGPVLLSIRMYCHQF